MKLLTFLRGTGWALACILSVAALPSAFAAVDETNRRVTDIENLFDRLRSHADFLGFRYDRSVAPAAWGEVDRTSTHFQGIARSSVAGRPYLFVTRAGMSDDDRARLLIVRMGSRNTTGERMRSNRYEKGDSVEGTQPPENDTLVGAYTFRSYQHPGGIQLCGDILAVPLEGALGDAPEGLVEFFDASDPENLQRLPVRLESNSKIGIVGLTKLPDGKFLLVTTGGDGDRLKFYRSNKSSFFEAGFEFLHHDTFDVRDVTGGEWTTGKTSHQALQLMINRDDSGNETVYLITGRNDKVTTPFLSGKDLLYLYKVSGWEAGGTIRIREIKQRQMHTDSGNSANGELAVSRNQPSSYYTDSNANFLAGLCSYVSPTGELLVYAIEHFNWGPRGSVRFVEFRHEQVYREGNPIYDKEAILKAPDFVLEDSTTTLDAGDSKRLGSVRPWVEIFEDANYNGRSVIMDWADRDKEDFKDLRQLSWPDGFNDKASSVRWFAPLGWRIRLYDGDNYKINDNEPYLDLQGLGYQNGIRVLSDKPYEFDNSWYDGVVHETRVTSMKFIPPGSSSDLDDWLNVGDDPGTEQDADDGWSNAKEHLSFRWRLLDENLNPYPTSSATLTPVPGSPWLATLRTFTRASEALNVELFVGPPLEKRLVRRIRFLKQNRTPTIVSTSKNIVGNRVDLTVIVKDDDTSDAIKLFAQWGNLPERFETEGANGQRTFTLSRTFTNPDPDQILRSDIVIRLRAEDPHTASSPVFEDHVRITWRNNAPPQITPETFERAVLSGFKTRIQTLLANDSDPDGDFFGFAGIRGVYPDGATVSEQDGWLLYTPAPGAGHLPGGFDYALRDQFGAIATGRVNVVPQSATTVPSLNLVSVQPRTGGGKLVEFQGLPGRTYTVDATSLLFGSWSRLGQATADSVGRLQIEDPGAGVQRFYRTQLLTP